MSMTLGILNNREDISGFNDTNITLIPKIKSLVVAKPYRPIGSCNKMYKLVSKTILNRLKPFMSSIIHDSQSAFVEKRLITDSFIIAFEAFHSMSPEKINGSNNFAMKLDLIKAFDMIEWNYLDSVMLAMKFPRTLVSLIMRCTRFVQFLVLVNSIPTTSFSLTRGICQGDPLSPYLCIICAEGLPP